MMVVLGGDGGEGQDEAASASRGVAAWCCLSCAWWGAWRWGVSVVVGVRWRVVRGGCCLASPQSPQQRLRCCLSFESRASLTTSHTPQHPVQDDDGVFSKGVVVLVGRRGKRRSAVRSKPVHHCFFQLESLLPNCGSVFMAQAFQS